MCCCDMNIFFSVLKQLPSWCLIKKSQSSNILPKTFIIHDNLVLSVKVIGISDGIPLNLWERMVLMFTKPRRY